VWGWLIYTIVIGIFFLFVKSINYRLHRLFGIDPILYEKKEETKDEDAEVKKKPENEAQDTDTDGDLVDEYPTKKDQTEKTFDVDMHKSASSLNSTTDMGSLDSNGGVLELSRRSSGSRHASVKSSPKLSSRDNASEVS